jgi:hypothetical protein
VRLGQLGTGSDASIGDTQPIGHGGPCHEVGIFHESATVREVIHDKDCGQRRSDDGSAAGQLPKTGELKR